MTALDDEARLIAILTHLRTPFDRKQIDKLPATAKRPALDYVGHAYVTDRLNTTAPDWTYDFRTIEVERDGLPHVLAIVGTMTIRGVSRMEVGDVDKPSTYGQELKEAISDFVRRAAMRFGVALELWAKGELELLKMGDASAEGSGLASSAGGAEDGRTVGSDASGNPAHLRSEAAVDAVSAPPAEDAPRRSDPDVVVATAPPEPHEHEPGPRQLASGKVLCIHCGHPFKPQLVRAPAGEPDEGIRAD